MSAHNRPRPGPAFTQASGWKAFPAAKWLRSGSFANSSTSIANVPGSASVPPHPGPAQPIDLSVERPLPRSLAVHPTQLYSTIDALILCVLLLCYDRFRRRDGELTALMITVYPITRFLIERIRTDEAAIWGTGLHISQNISLGILAVAVCLWIYILRQPAKLAFGNG